VAVLLSLLASVLWGGSDFLGGTATRRLPLPVVLLVSQSVALVGLLVVAAGTGSFAAPLGYLPWAAAGGLVGMLALGAFYRALATGTMGVVAPVAALGVAVPVVVGVMSGQRPGARAGAGRAGAVLGVVLVSGPDLAAGRSGRPGAAGRPLLLAVAAAVGFGGVIVFVQRGSRHDVVMTLLMMRATSVTLMLVLAAARRRAPRFGARDLPLLTGVGVGDVAANACYAVASRQGLLPVVAVLSSLYPAVTALLARRVHDERLRPAQVGGLIGTLAGVALIAAGGTV
jgi:drug/metabolite transporter (DMT)-like permease